MFCWFKPWHLRKLYFFLRPQNRLKISKEDNNLRNAKKQHTPITLTTKHIKTNPLFPTYQNAMRTP